MKHTIILRVAALAMAASLAPTYATRLKDIDNANNSANKYIDKINDDLKILGADLGAGVPSTLVNEKGKKGYSDTLKNQIATLTEAVTTLQANLDVALTNANTRIDKLKKLNELQSELAAKQAELAEQEAELAEQEAAKHNSHSSTRSRGSRGRR